MGNGTILGIGGSFRKGSYNRYLLESSASLLPSGYELVVADISGLPMFNEDDEANPPTAVKEFKSQIEDADAVIIATPEYNFSVPGYLKNAIDLASRFGSNSFRKKPVAIMSASRSMLGGSRAQYHLRQVFVGLDARVINKPEVFVGLAHEKFDNNGKLIDESALKFIADLLVNLVKEAESVTA